VAEPAAEAPAKLKDEGPDNRFVEIIGTGPRWCVGCDIVGKNVDFLIDTGANPNILSKDIFESIPACQRPVLHPSDKSLKVANGKPMMLCGETMMILKIDGKDYCVPIIVAETGNLRGILGMQFLTENRCVVDVGAGVLKINGQEVVMNQLDGLKICRVVLAEDLQVEGRQELVVQGRVEGARWDSSDVVGVIEPCGSLMMETGLVIPGAVVRLQGDNVLLTVGNRGNNKIDVSKGTVLALLHPIDSIEEIVVEDPREGIERLRSGTSEGDYLPCDASDLPEHLQLMVQGVTELDGRQMRQLCGLLKEYEEIFMAPGGQLGRTGIVKHKIDVQGSCPIKQPTRRLPMKMKQVVEEELQKMLDNDVIEPSQSPWSSPVVLVTKKDGSIRFCVDYRRLNQVTRKDAYPLPNINDCLDALSGAKWFSTIDLVSGFWQLLMDEDSKPMTAFTTHKGLYEFKVLPFGLTNAPAGFERLMEQVLRGLQWEKCLVYLDDIIIFGSDFASALDNLRAVFDRIRISNLKLKPKKCNLFQKEVGFLGHVVSGEGVACDPAKTEAVSKWKVPHSVTEVRSFLGLASYYRRFIKGFASIASPLTALTEKNRTWEWTEECQIAFEILKGCLTKAPILAYPSPDPNDKFILDTDASDSGIGGVLSQVQNGVERVVAYASKTLSKTERRYCTTYRELLAVVFFMKKFRHYLLGQEFTVRTDHSSLRWLTNFKDVEGMVGRWLSSISPFSYKIEHRSGVNHGNADGLSRKMIQDKRRRCGREECPECPTDSANYIEAIGTSFDWESSDFLGIEKMEQSLLIQVDEKQNKLAASDKIPAVEVLTRSNGGSTSDGTANVPDSNRLAANLIPSGDLPDDLVPSVPVNWCSTWTNEDLIAMQQNDRDISKVAGWVGNRRDPPNKTELAGENECVRSLCSQWAHLTIREGLLYRNWSDKHDSSRQIVQLVAPQELRQDIFSHLHKERVGGHLGISKTLENVRRRFYWPGCKSDIRRWCEQCSSCAQIKPGPRHRTRLKQIVASSPLDCVAIDLLGELPETDNGNRYILVVTDYFTKWTQAFALPNMTAQTVADVLTSEFFCFFGAPRQLHSDQGRQFESNLFQEVCKLLGIKKSRTTPYRPQSDGMVERFNRTIQQMLKHFVNDNRNDWDDHLPYLMMAYRSSQHESTGCSPNLLMLGREISMPLDVMVGHSPDKSPACPIEYVEWLRDSMTNAHDYAANQLKKSAKRQKRNYDLNAIHIDFSVDQFVWRWYPPKANQKLGKGWTGPFRIMSRPTDVNAVIRYRPGDQDIRVHIDHLKPYHGDVPVEWVDFDLVPEQEESIPAREDVIPTTDELEPAIDQRFRCSTDSCRRGNRLRKPPTRLDL
jgi:predicted aspartyl protease